MVLEEYNCEFRANAFEERMFERERGIMSCSRQQRSSGKDDDNVGVGKKDVVIYVTSLFQERRKKQSVEQHKRCQISATWKRLLREGPIKRSSLLWLGTEYPHQYIYQYI